METKEYTVYQFDELSDSAKDRARDWYRNASAGDFADFGAESVIEDASRLAAMFGLNINTRPIRTMGGNTRMEPNVYWEVASRSAGCSFAGSYSYQRGAVSAVEEEAPSTWQGEVNKSNTELNRIVRELQDVQRRNFYRLQATTEHRHRAYIEMDIVVERNDEIQICPHDADIVVGCLQDFASWILANLEREFEYQSSDEIVDENIRANEYTFDEDGNRED